MGEFFKGWKRKLGLTTLLLACLSTSGWIRSLRMADDLSFASYHFLSVHGGIFCEDLSELPETRSFVFRSRRASGYVNVYEELRHVWKWRFLGIAIGHRELPTRSVNGKSISTKRYYYVRYELPFVVLTLLSAYLLLRKPRQATKVPA